MTTYTKAIEILDREYRRALKIPYIRSPLAYALYQTWKTVDKEVGSFSRKKVSK